MGTDFENAVLIARQRPGKSASPSGKVHRQCMWSGRTTHASMWNGARRRACRTALRNASICVTNRSDRRSSKFTVKKECPTRNSIAAIIRHKRIMPNLKERRNALCFSALRLLTPRATYCLRGINGPYLSSLEKGASYPALEIIGKLMRPVVLGYTLLRAGG